MTSHTAPGQAAGYMFQPERALYWLATSPALTVGIETEDDVVVHLQNGSSVREQDKSTISGRVPFGDRSKDLWNTLGIWVDAASAKQIDLETCLLLLVGAARGPPRRTVAVVPASRPPPRMPSRRNRLSSWSVSWKVAPASRVTWGYGRVGR